MKVGSCASLFQMANSSAHLSFSLRASHKSMNISRMSSRFSWPNSSSTIPLIMCSFSTHSHTHLYQINQNNHPQHLSHFITGTDLGGTPPLPRAFDSTPSLPKGPTFKILNFYRRRLGRQYILALMQCRNFCRNEILSVLGALRKSICSKKSSEFSKTFDPLEKILDPPLTVNT